MLIIIFLLFFVILIFTYSNFMMSLIFMLMIYDGNYLIIKLFFFVHVFLMYNTQELICVVMIMMTIKLCRVLY